MPALPSSELEVLIIASERYSREYHLTLAAEECCELALLCNRFLRGDREVSIESIAEEIADVELMLRQLIVNYRIENEVLQGYERKLDRLENILEPTITPACDH